MTAGLPLAASAAPEDDYLAARDMATTAAVTAARAGRSDDAAVIKAEEAALKDLGKRMTALVGPVKLKGLGTPAYTLDVLLYGEDEPTRQLDGIAVASKDDTTRAVVVPEGVFNAWLQARAKDKDAPPAFRDGLKAAAATGYFFNTSIINEGGGFTPYVPLPVAAADGETTYAGLGLFSDEAPANTPPNSIVIVRVANGRAVVGVTSVKLDTKSLTACAQVWKPYGAKIAALQKAIEKDGRAEDPRWDQIGTIEDEGSAAFRACFAKEAPGQPFFATAAKRAEAFLQTARDN